MILASFCSLADNFESNQVALGPKTDFVMTWLNIVLVNGNWGSWDAWDACSVTCGNGTRTRERRCNNPTPSIGEATCTGSAVEQDNCYLLDCPPAGRISNSNFNLFASSSKDS